jgi:streptomycin 6-kinase
VNPDSVAAIRVGEPTARRVVCAFGSRGQTWVDALPDVVRELTHRWDLVELGEPFPGARAAFVAPARDRDGRELVLKISPDLEWARHEHEALVHCGGSGALPVLGFADDLGAILQERASPGESLRSGSSAAVESSQIFADVAERLRAPTRPLPVLPALTSWLTPLASPEIADAPEGLSRHRREAQDVAARLIGLPGRQSLLHGDLHHSNILRHGGVWIAVDPKGVIGPAEAEPAAFLRNPRGPLLQLDDPIGHLTTSTLGISRRLGYDPLRVAGWAYVLGVMAAIWAIEDAEGLLEAEKWLRCAELLHDSFRTLARS